MKGITYRTTYSDVWLHRLHDITHDRYGLFEGRCTWMCLPGAFEQAIPKKRSGHPLYPWLELERWSSRTQGAFVAIEAEYYGIEDNDSEPVYELSNSAGEFPIESHPNFLKLFEGPRLNLKDVTDENGRFIGFPFKLNDGSDYPEDRNMAGIESYLGYGEVVWRKVWNSRDMPKQEDLELVGRIDRPDGDIPTPKGRDWLLITNTFTQKGMTFRRTKEWKLSGPKGANPLIYNYQKK